jgi:hypothetical protein
LVEDQISKKLEIRVQELSARKSGTLEVKVLGRIISRTIRGITIEADPRHAQAIVEHLDLSGANGVVTPCEVQKEVLWTERAEVHTSVDILDWIGLDWTPPQA